MLKIMLSLAKYYNVSNIFLWVAWIFPYWPWFFLLSVAKHFPSDLSKLKQNKWRSLQARWPIILQSVSQQQRISSLISIFRKHTLLYDLYVDKLPLYFLCSFCWYFYKIVCWFYFNGISNCCVFASLPVY